MSDEWQESSLTPQEELEKFRDAWIAMGNSEESLATRTFPVAEPEETWVGNLMSDFTDMRIARAQKLAEIYDFTDPNVMAQMLGDMVTLIENIHIATNPMPADGFVSLTPKDPDGSDK